MDVAFGITDVECVLRVGVDLSARIQHGFDAGLGFAAGVAADDDGGWDDEAEFGDEFVGEAHGFVGDDAPFDAALVEFGNEFVHAVKELGVLGVAAVVFLQIFGAPSGIVGVVGGDACAELEQSCRAVAGLGADLVHAFCR
ncbi:Uncharacterised protein [Neisseria meningitidis]|nr:Uncharacterised protein [Neisseria meningitidis]